MSKRSYVLKQRAESQEETRRRILEATIELHEERGPRETSISAIAEKAGVRRLTVYRHFPSETELFRACTSQWIAHNPPPDPASWQDGEGLARIGAALAGLYAYYARTERMWTVSYRDETEVEALREPMQQIRAYLDAVRDNLAGHLPAPPEQAMLVRATLGGAVQFATWQALARQGLDAGAMAGLVCRWLAGVTTTRSG